MKTQAKNKFKAVDYMRKVREELSTLIQTDPERYHKELKNSMADFLVRRGKPAANVGLAQAGQTE